MATLLQMVLLILPLSGLGTPLDVVETVYLHTSNLQEVPPALLEDAHIHGLVSSRGYSYQKLYWEPIGYVGPEDTIVISVAIEKLDVEEDRNPLIGIADENNNTNVFLITNEENYNELPPCFVFDGSHDDELVHEGTKMSFQFKFTFQPGRKYGKCETAQQGGYINTGYFASNLDLSLPLYLCMYRTEAQERYTIYYFLVEIIRHEP